MVLYRIYSQEYRIRYLAHPYSTAVLFQIICLILTFLPPLFTSYFTGGFYSKELTYSEQPNVSFLGKYNIWTDSLSNPFFSSNDARLNNYFITSYQPSTLGTSIPQDTDGDGISDQITIIIDTIFPDNSYISGQSINLWLTFQYTLNQYPLYNMETLGVISLKAPSLSSTTTSNTATIYGNLRFQQRDPLLNYVNYSSSQGPIIDYGSFSLVPSFSEIFINYTNRNSFTTFDPQYVQWASSTSTDSSTSFTIKVVVYTGLQLIRYVPSFWKVFRWTWIQYVTALLPFFYIANKVKEFAFSNGLVRTVVRKSS